MGQAKRRGTFDERKEQAIVRRAERWRVGSEERHQRQMERFARMDSNPIVEERRPAKVGIIGHGGYGGSPWLWLLCWLLCWRLRRG